MDNLKIKFNIEDELYNIKKKIESLKLKPLEIKLEVNTYNIQNELSKLQLKCDNLIEKTKLVAENIKSVNNLQTSNDSKEIDFSPYLTNDYFTQVDSDKENIKFKKVSISEETNVDSIIESNNNLVKSEEKIINIQEAKSNAYISATKSSDAYIESLKTQASTTESATSISTKKNYEYIESENQVVKAQNISKASTIALNIAKSALNGVIGFGINLAINFAVKAIDNYINRHEKLIEKAQESKEKSKSLNNDIINLGSEIEKISQRIKELNSIENPSIYEQEELENLKSLNKELERNLFIKQQQAELANKEARENAEKTFNDEIATSTTYSIGNGTVYSTLGADKITRTERIQQNSNEYEKLIKEREKYLNIMETGTESEYDDAKSTVDNINRTLDTIKSTILSDLSILNDMSGLLDENDDKYKNFISTYNSSQSTMKRAEISTINKFFSNNFNKEIETGLRNLASKGNLTVKQITDLYPSLSEDLEPYGLTIDDIAERFNQLYTSSNEFADNQKSDIQSLTDSLSEYSSKMSTIQSAQDEITNTNSLSYDTIQNLIGKYPELEGVLTGYLSGLKSTSDIYSILSQQYIIDENNFKSALAAKNQTNEEFYNSLIKTNTDKVNKFNEIYDIDLKNFKNLAQAKLAIENKFFSKDKWSQWYDSETGKYTEEAMTAAGSGDQEFYKFYQSMSKKDKALKDLDEITFEGIKIDSKSFSSGNSTINTNTIDTLKNEFTEKYNQLKEQRSNDIINAQQYYDKLKKLNNDYFANKPEYADEYQLYDLELHRLSQDLAEKKIKDWEFNLQLKINAVGEAETAGEQIKIYTQIQDELHRLAEEERNRKVGKNEELIQKYSQQWWEYEQKKFNITKQYYDKQKSLYEGYISTIEKIQDMTISMIKKEMEMNKELHAEKIKSINDEFDLKRNLLDDELDEYNYNKELQNKIDNVNKIQSQIDLIKNDESNKGKLKQLEDELKNATTELDDFQYNRDIDLQKQILDEKEQLLVDKHQAEIDAIDKKLNDEAYLKQLADDKIKSSGQNLYNELITFAEKYGTISKHEVDEIWLKYSEIMDNFDIRQNGATDTLANLHSQLNDIKQVLEDINGMALGDYGAYQNQLIDSKITKMKDNSQAWHNPDSNKSSLEKKNNDLANELKDLGVDIKKEDDGYWYYKSNGKRVYHNGGIVSNNGTNNLPLHSKLKPNELHSILEEGELVISKNGVKNLLENIVPIKNISTLGLPNYNYTPIPNLLSSINHTSSTGDIVIENNYNITGTTSEELLNNMKQMVDINSNYTIKKIAELAKNNSGNKINTIYKY